MPDRYLGQLLGKYRATRLLGTGSFSWVYEAVDSETGLTVALKILRPEYAGQPQAEARFRREAETAARLRHPNIVAVRDVGHSGDTAYVAMDLLPLTLARRLELVHRIPETEVVRVGLDVASALALAHAQGVVHRDIKPDNILISDNGEAVVGDFGLARAIEGDPSLSASQQVMGTPHYFSPEQARGLPVDGRSDLYALGVTLFRAATGRLPYEGEDWYSVAKQHIEAPVPAARSIVPELSEQFDAVLMRLLAKRPDERLSSATSLIDALAQLPTAPERTERRGGSGSADATMISPAPLSAAVRDNRRRWIRRGGIGAVALTAAALLVFQQQLFRLDANAGAGVGIAPDSTGSLLVAPFTPSDTAPPSDSLLATTLTFGSTDGSPAKDVPAPRPDSTNGRGGTVRAPARRGRLEITTDPEATLYVENRVVGIGSHVVEIPTNRDVKIRAAFPEAKPDCGTALRDTTVNVSDGSRHAFELRVLPCGSLTLDVTPRSASITLQSQLDGSRITVRADTVGALLLPAGRYALEAHAFGYAAYANDFVVIRPGGPAAHKRIVMARPPG